MASPYRHWQLAARGLLEPLAALMQPGRADLPLAGTPSDHDAQADRLESFARPLALAAFFLHSEPHADDHAFRAALATWFRDALLLGTNPDSPHSFGPDASYHQHHVEMSLIALALQLAPASLWQPFSPAERAQIARWFATCRGGGIVNNNHLFMSVHILEFLGAHGFAQRTDRVVIDAHLNQLETMHRGGGWFEDGINQAYDHYNAYAFHFYGLMWSHLHGAVTPRAPRAGATTPTRSSATTFISSPPTANTPPSAAPSPTVSTSSPPSVSPPLRTAPTSPPACSAASVSEISISSSASRSPRRRAPSLRASPTASTASSSPTPRPRRRTGPPRASRRSCCPRPIRSGPLPRSRCRPSAPAVSST